MEEDNNFLPPTDYADYGENQQTEGNTFLEIGNPAEKNRSGNIIISGYINDRDTKDNATKNIHNHGDIQQRGYR